MRGKMYCDVISVFDKRSEKTYEVKEDVIHKKRLGIKSFLLVGDCNIICSCHLFEFRGNVRRHVISVLMRNRITSLPETYILRRWGRDVCRAHTRVTVNYDALVSNPS